MTYLWEKDSKYDLLYASMADIQPLIQLFWMHMNDSLWIHYHNKCFISHWELEIKLLYLDLHIWHATICDPDTGEHDHGS